jgi:hypothetical protein
LVLIPPGPGAVTLRRKREGHRNEENRSPPVRGTARALLGALALVGLSVPADAAAYPAPGVYGTSPPRVVLPSGYDTFTETILGTVVDLHGFTVIVQITNVSAGTITSNCVLSHGRIKTASDTHLSYDGLTFKGYDSTCTYNKKFSAKLSPHQSAQFWVAFRNPPPPLGTAVTYSSIFGTPSGSLVRHSTAPFDPYGAGTGLRIVKAAPPSERSTVAVLDDGIEMFQDIAELLYLIPIEVVDIQLLSPWLVCGQNLTWSALLSAHQWRVASGTTVNNDFADPLARDRGLFAHWKWTGTFEWVR